MSNIDDSNGNIETDVNLVSESSQQSTPKELNDSEEARMQRFIAGFEEKFAVGKAFTSIADLRHTATDYGKLHNVAITTLTSSLKQGSITLHCKHGGKYRAAKRNGTATITTESQKPRATTTSRSGCPMIINARRNGFGMITIRHSVSSHNHPIASDMRKYAAFRKMEAHHLEAAISLLRENSSSTVLEVRLLVIVILMELGDDLYIFIIDYDQSRCQ